MDTIRSIISSFQFETVIRLLLGLILAGIIGSERESENKPAGFKTHSLIGISAVVVMLLGQYYGKISGSDAARLPAQLISGIGFIGAGTILRDGLTVKGLTTASSLLAVTCIGLCVGAGFYIGAIVATIIVYFILRRSYTITSSLDHYISLVMHLKVDNFSTTINVIQDVLSKNDIQIKRIKNNQNKDKNKVLIACKYHKDTNINSVLTEISSLDDVTDLEVE